MNNFLLSNIFNGIDGSENVIGLDFLDFLVLVDWNRREGSGNLILLINFLVGRVFYVGMVIKLVNE